MKKLLLLLICLIPLIIWLFGIPIEYLRDQAYPRHSLIAGILSLIQITFYFPLIGFFDSLEIRVIPLSLLWVLSSFVYSTAFSLLTHYIAKKSIQLNNKTSRDLMGMKQNKKSEQGAAPNP